MSDTPSMKIDLPGVDFRAMAQQAIATKLSEAFLGSEDIVKKIIVAAIDHKVNDKGVVGSSYENRVPYIEWLAHDLIRTAVLDVLKAKVDGLRPALEKEIEKQLRSSAKDTAKALAKSFAASAGNSYALKCDVVLKINQRD